MSSMIERVARALAETDPEYDPEWDYAEQARAAIEAMREPTPDMIKRAHGYTHLTSDKDAFWKAMIDAALTYDPDNY